MSWSLVSGTTVCALPANITNATFLSLILSSRSAIFCRARVPRLGSISCSAIDSETSNSTASGAVSSASGEDCCRQLGPAKISVTKANMSNSALSGLNRRLRGLRRRRCCSNDGAMMDLNGSSLASLLRNSRSSSSNKNGSNSH